MNFGRVFTFFLVVVFMILSHKTLEAQTIPINTEIYAKMKLVNDYWINGHPTPGDNYWLDAVYNVGNMAMYYTQNEQQYYNYALQWAIQNNWVVRQGTSTRDPDNQIAGSTYIDLYNIEPDPIKIQAIKTCIDNMVSSPINDWNYIDTQFMAMPEFTKLGILYNDTSYYNKMYDLYQDCKVQRVLYDTTAHLWYRDARFIYPGYKTPTGKKCFWSRGNGWVFGAHAYILNILPESDPHFQEYLLTFQEMANALKDVQRSDGFWNVSLYDPLDYPGPESSGTAFFAYGMAWGINHGYLDRATYEPVIAKAWNGLITNAVQSNGFLGYVQGEADRPSSKQPVTVNNTASFGVGIFLLAGSEIYKLATSPPSNNLNIIWRNYSTGENVQWNMTGTTYVDYNWLPQVADTHWRIKGVGNFNTDSKADLIWHNDSTGENVIWFMNGASYLSSVRLPQITDTNWDIGGIDDFNIDTKLDILWKNIATGENAIWFMNDTTYISSTALPQVSDIDWKIVGTGDFNADGNTDILWRNLGSSTESGKNVVWFMNGSNYTDSAWLPQIADTNWQIAGVADFNLNNQLDILWRNYYTGENIVWLMNGTTYVDYAWLPQIADINWRITGVLKLP